MVRTTPTIIVFNISSCRLHRSGNSAAVFFVCLPKQIFSQELSDFTINVIDISAQYQCFLPASIKD